jgi:hypothetical protein
MTHARAHECCQTLLKLALEPAGRQWLNRQRQLRTKTRKHTTHNLRLRLLSTTKREICVHRTALEARPIGRAESVPVEAFACLLWGVSSHAPFIGNSTGSAGEKMKTKMLVALVAVTSVTLLTSCKPKISGQIVTNWVKPSEGLRVVNGQLYDSYHSELWKNPLELAGFHSHANANFRLVTSLAKIETVAGNKIQCGVYAQAHWPPVANGEVESEDMVQEIVIYHYPNAESLVSGQLLGDCRCMRVANYNAIGISYAAFDCGVQSTELVPEIKGAIVKAGDVQILLVDAKEADDFLQKKKVESDQRSALITADIEKYQSELNTNKLELDEARKVASQSYTNDARFVALAKESEEGVKTADKLAAAIQFLKAKYGTPPDMLNQPFVRQYSQEQRAAWQAIREDTQRIQTIYQRSNRMVGEDDSLQNRIKNERSMQIQASIAALEAAKEKLDAANQSLKSFQTPYFYLADFSPAVLEMSQTDAKGKFTVHNPKVGTKVFAKVKSDETGEVFFWLLNSPQKGERLILSDSTLFTAPANTP